MNEKEAALFRLRQVRKQYRDIVAVDMEDLELPAGEILCLLGPTGAGKSTLLRLLAAVERPTTGDIFYADDSMPTDSLPTFARRQITMVFQRPKLLTGTVRANVEYGLRIRGEKNSAARKVERILERMGLTDLAGQSANTLSGGQTQLVALARALVLEPKVLLLDEPTANLDPAHVALVERVIEEEFLRRQTSVIWATHNVFQAQRSAHRVALILDGRLVELASTDVFFHSPSDPRTSDFVEGKMIY